MTHFAAKSAAASQATEESPSAHELAGVAGARVALTLLLELGTRVLDGDTSALLGVPDVLARAIERLRDVHQSLRDRALHASTPFFAVLAQHAEHRRRSDFRELDALSAAVIASDDPTAMGRSVVVAALVLLSNLESDERWYYSLKLPKPFAAAA